MRTSLKLFPALIMAVILTVGCASSNSKTLSDEEILEKVSPYLEQLVYQDPASYASLDDFLRANLGLDTTTVESVTLYLGDPIQNTGCFLMLTPAKDADLESIEASLEAKGDSMAKAAQMGYTQGYSEYSVLQTQGRFFLVMQADADRYDELVQLLSEL